MGKKDKLINKLRTNPKDFTFDEAETLLGLLSFRRSNKGKTSGSRVKYINDSNHCVILLHRPHPEKELKAYQIKQLLDILSQEGMI